MDNDEVTASWINGLNQQMSTDPLVFIVLTHMMALVIRKSLKEKEIATFLSTISKKLRKTLMDEYKVASANPDPDLPDHEEFAVGLDQQLKLTTARVRELLIREDNELDI